MCELNLFLNWLLYINFINIRILWFQLILSMGTAAQEQLVLKRHQGHTAAHCLLRKFRKEADLQIDTSQLFKACVDILYEYYYVDEVYTCLTRITLNLQYTQAIKTVQNRAAGEIFFISQALKLVSLFKTGALLLYKACVFDASIHAHTTVYSVIIQNQFLVYSV